MRISGWPHVHAITLVWICGCLVSLYLVEINGYFFNPCSESVKAKRKCDTCCDNKILVFDEVVALQKKKVRRDPFKEKLLIRSKDHLAEELIDSFSNLVHKQGLFLIFKWFLSVRWFP